MVGRARCVHALIAAALSIGGAGGTAAQTKRELTPADALATTRILQNQELPGHAVEENFASPDGQRFMYRVAYGDVPLNGIWVDFWTGSLQSLEAAKPRRCAHLFTTGLGQRDNDIGANWDPTSANIVKWVGNHEVAFLWSDSDEVRQVMSIDLLSCRHRFLTRSPTSVYAFAAGADGTLLVDARIPRRKLESPLRWEEGFTLPESTDAWSILRNDVNGGNLAAVADDTTWSILSSHGSLPIKILGDSIDRTNPSLRPLVISPNGRFAITYVGLKDLPDAWRAYPDSYLQHMYSINPERPGLIPVTFLVFDLKAAAAHLLWSAPSGTRGVFAFSPDGNTVLLAPTFLPLPISDAAALSGHAAAVIDVRSGDSEPIPIDLGHRVVVQLHWDSRDRVAIHSTNDDGSDLRLERFAHVQSHWVVDAERSEAIPPPHLQIRVRQTLNEPPKIWAVGAHGGERLLMDLDPHLQATFKLGRVERRSGTLPDGHTWLAQLIYPADYEPGRRYPLVIQCTYAKSWGDEEYTLDGTWGGSGMGLGPSEFPSYPGQLLASRNIAVLQLEMLHSSSGIKEPEEHQLLFETLAEELSDSGLVDRNKVALAGFSRNGYWVDYTLTHSSFPFAAAITADNYDPGYFTSALAGWWSFDTEVNGASAFGSGLQSWLVRAPGFNAEHIHTPLRMMGQSLGGIAYLMSKWEIYSRLRYLKRPVEIAVMPDIDRHPAHNPQNPRQLMAIQDSSLDWLTFWLEGREDPNPQKREQYMRWHRLQELQTSSTSQASVP